MEEFKKHEKSNILFILLVVLILGYLLGGGYRSPAVKNEPTKAVESDYGLDIASLRKATTSENITNADIAWHALNTYGWDCDEVVTKSELTSEGYYNVECKNGKGLRVYPRKGMHPRITNANGTYK
jgi:hypothetical protein